MPDPALFNHSMHCLSLPACAPIAVQVALHAALRLPPGVLVAAFVSQPGQRALVMDELVPAAMASSVCRKMTRSGSAASYYAVATGEAPALHMVSSMVLQMLQARYRRASVAC